ncbi:hypothetical protein GALMADRAFT_132737 [Galerina marginata CBS 339.88]|uniref:DUF6534 domain-containing protein n=1 Tax=Galerina marginata (strain CBS 339.88) TaxID=685588 RepID=A0A067TUX3_GALM3|nr:hypothetical protein GALMADRAFT_132737 [Galerina marginata CBS 339.88]
MAAKFFSGFMINTLFGNQNSRYVRLSPHLYSPTTAMSFPVFRRALTFPPDHDGSSASTTYIYAKGSASTLSRTLPPFTMSTIPLAKSIDLPNTFGEFASLHPKALIYVDRLRRSFPDWCLGFSRALWTYNPASQSLHPLPVKAIDIHDQTYLYYVYYPKDGQVTKLLVAFIWFLETVHFAFMSFGIYFYLVTNYFNPAGLVDGHWTLYLSLLVNIVIVTAVHSFFITRIMRLCEPKFRRWVASVLGVLVVCNFAFGTETVVFLFKIKEISRIPEIKLFAATPFAVFAVAGDISIAALLCYLLYGSRTGFRGTDTILTTLIIYAVERCVLTAAAAVIEVIVFSIKPHSLWFVAIDFVVGRLYANSLLATLNSRASVQAIRGDSIHSVQVSTGIQFNDMSGGTNTKVEGRDVVLDLRSDGNNSQSTYTSRNIQERSLDEHFRAKQPV